VAQECVRSRPGEHQKALRSINNKKKKATWDGGCAEAAAQRGGAGPSFLEVAGFGVRFQGLDFEFRVSVSGFRVQGAGFRV